ncbi:MAG: P-II family nitrogen regulator [Bacteroidota bacterium]|nr:P-II family nitrogen regulator [Bacteroidota bacterium]
MKLILAIIRIAKMNETKQVLSDAGLPSFTAMGVLGRGRGRGEGQNFQEILKDPANQDILKEITMPRLKSKRLITLVVTDEKKDLAVETIIKVNQSGNSGDGKIFVIEALDSIRVRTGEAGDLTLD